MATRENALECMRSYIDITEQPPRSNRTPIGREFANNGVAWCAQTVSLALCGAHYEAGAFRYSGGFWDGSKITLPRRDWPRGWQYVPSIWRAFQAEGRFDKSPRPGSLVCFQWSGNEGDSHVGMVETVHGDGTWTGIEGNHNDRCERVRRDMTSVVGFAHPPYDTNNEEELTMADIEALKRHLDEGRDAQTAHLDLAADNRLRDVLEAIRGVGKASGGDGATVDQIVDGVLNGFKARLDS